MLVLAWPKGEDDAGKLNGSLYSGIGSGVAPEKVPSLLQAMSPANKESFFTFVP